MVAFPSEFTSYPLCCTIVSFLSHYIIDTLNVYVLQDHVVYVHRNWTYLDSMDIEKEESSYPIQKLMSQLPQSLHGQFHGREIHSVHFVSAGNIPVTSQHGTKWIATGAEDGAVRISRLDSLQ